MPEEPSDNPFYDNLSQLISGTENVIRSASHRFRPIQQDGINYVEGTFYSNIMLLFKHNLNVKYFKAVKMEKEDAVELRRRLAPFFKRAQDTTKNIYNKGEVDFLLYQDFRREVYDFGDDAYWLLLGVERYIDLIACELRIIQFKNDMLQLELEGTRPKGKKEH